MPNSNNNNERELYLAFCPKCKANFGDYKNKKCLCNNPNAESFSKNMTTLKNETESKGTTSVDKKNAKKGSSINTPGSSKHMIKEENLEKDAKFASEKSKTKKTQSNEDNSRDLNTKDLEKSLKDCKQPEKSTTSTTCTHKSFVEEGVSIFKVTNIDTTGDICLSRSSEYESKEVSEFKEESFRRNLKKVIDPPKENKIKTEIINEIGDKICDLIEHKDKNGTRVYDVFILDKEGNVGSYELSRIEEENEKEEFPDQVLEELGYQKGETNLSQNICRGNNVDVIFGDPVKNPGKVVWKFKSQSGQEESFDFDEFEKERRREMVLNIAKEAEENPEEMFCLCKSIEIVPIKLPNLNVNLCSCCKNRANNEVGSNYKNQKCLLCEKDLPEYENMNKKDMPVSLQCNDEKFCKNSQKSPSNETKKENEFKDGICYGCKRISFKKCLLKDKKDLFPCAYCLKISKDDEFVCCLTAEEKKQNKSICGDVKKISEKKFTSLASSSESSKVLPLEVTVKKDKKSESEISMKLPSHSTQISTQKVTTDETAKSKNELEIIMLSRENKSKEEKEKKEKSTDRSKITITFDDVPVKEKSSESTSSGTSSKITFLIDEKSVTSSKKSDKKTESKAEEEKISKADENIEAPKEGIEVTLKTEDVSGRSLKESEKPESVKEEEKSKSSINLEKSSSKSEVMSPEKSETKSLTELEKKSSTKESTMAEKESTKEESKTEKSSVKEAVEFKPVDLAKQQIETVISTTEIKEIEKSTSKVSETESSKKEETKPTQSLLSKAIESFKSSLASENKSETKKSVKNEPISIISQVGSKKGKLGDEEKSKASVEIIETTFSEEDFPIPKEPIYITNYKGSKISLNPQGRVARLIKHFEELAAKKRKEKEKDAFLNRKK